MALFEERCARLRCHNASTSDTLIVLANKLAARTLHGTYEPFHNLKIFWGNCGEDDIKFPKECNGRMDPLLKLYKRSQLMLVFNNNVRHGEANRTTVTLISICLMTCFYQCLGYVLVVLNLSIPKSSFQDDVIMGTPMSS